MSKQNIIIGGLVALALILSVVALVSNKKSVPLGNATVLPSGLDTNYNEVGFNVDRGLIRTGWGKITLNSGENYGTFTNSTGATLYVDYGAAILSGIASSSFRFYVGTTTDTTISLLNYTAPTTTPALGKFTIATSSFGVQATSTAVYSGSKIPVANGESVYLLVQNITGQTCAYDGYHALSQNCDAATSTGRWSGDSAVFDFHYFR